MAVESQTPDPHTVILTVDVPRPAAEVYLDLTDAAALARWFWPERLRPTYEVGAVEGGPFRVRSEVAGIALDATYGELVPNRRITLDWRWDGADETTAVTVELADHGAATRVTVTHTGNPDEATRDDHRTGWSDCLARLAADG